MWMLVIVVSSFYAGFLMASLFAIGKAASAAGSEAGRPNDGRKPSTDGA